MADPVLFTVWSPAETVLTEKKSEFIANAFPCETEEDAAALIASVRERHRDARHVCFAYSAAFGQRTRQSDDGEPSGTAGVPILNLIRQNGLCNVCVTVTRYFGGILLGAPGLVRAYSAAARDALAAAGRAAYSAVARYRLPLAYGEYEKIRTLIEKHGGEPEKADFAERVVLTYAVGEDGAPALLSLLSEVSGGKLIPEPLGTERVKRKLS
ncbi:MAG: YigZ family protein [Clostridia bacterium]|nr:YigZ family protein [Clostridia bacterium]